MEPKQSGRGPRMVIQHPPPVQGSSDRHAEEPDPGWAVLGNTCSETLTNILKHGARQGGS